MHDRILRRSRRSIRPQGQLTGLEEPYYIDSVPAATKGHWVGRKDASAGRNPAEASTSCEAHD